MNIKQLRFAYAIARTESFSQAAEECFVTQPTLSNAIAQLEDELKNKLFERTTRSVQLTAFGQYMLPKIEKALHEIEQIHLGAQEWVAPSQKLIRLGISPVVDLRVLQNLIGPFKEKNPDIEFFYKECFLDDLRKRMTLGQLDLVVLPPIKPRVGDDHVSLYKEPLCFVPSRVSPLYELDEDSVQLKDVVNEKMILPIDACGLRSVTEDLFAHVMSELSIYPGQATSYSVVESWADIGIGSGILPTSKLSSDNKTARFLVNDKGERAMIEWEATWTKSAEKSDHVDAFIDFIRSEGPIKSAPHQMLSTAH